MHTGTMGCSWEKGGPRISSGLSEFKATFIVALVLVFYLQQRHLLYESMSVQSEKATSQEGHSCNFIHYHSAPGPVGSRVFKLQLLKSSWYVGVLVGLPNPMLSPGSLMLRPAIKSLVWKPRLAWSGHHGTQPPITISRNTHLNISAHCYPRAAAK